MRSCDPQELELPALFYIYFNTHGVLLRVRVGARGLLFTRFLFITPCKQVPESEFNFFSQLTAVPRINSRISARPLAASYLLRGGESKGARIHPL